MLITGASSPTWSYLSPARGGVFPATPAPAPPRPAQTPDLQRDPAETGQVNQKDKLEKQLGIKECETCRERRYQDRSNDPGVSMKSPTRLAPEQAAGAVAAHEQQHVFREQAKAEQDGREVVSQDVQIHTSICPECGRPYVSGGTTRTVTRAQGESPLPKPAEPGRNLDTYA